MVALYSEILLKMLSVGRGDTTHSRELIGFVQRLLKSYFKRVSIKTRCQSESLSYALFDGVVDPAESHWFGINIQEDWSCHHMIEHIVCSESKTF